jgi:phage terminase small subunit
VSKSYELDPRQQAFVQEYLATGNGGEAVRKAGYNVNGASAYSAATRLLRNDHVRIAIAEELERRNEKWKATQDEIVKKLLQIAFADIRQICTFDQINGVVFENSEDLTDDASAAIHEITDEKTVTYTKSGDEVERHKIKVKMYDRTKALEMLCRHLGMFKADEVGATQVMLEAALKRLAEGGVSMDDMVAHLRDGNRPSATA